MVTLPKEMSKPGQPTFHYKETWRMVTWEKCGLNRVFKQTRVRGGWGWLVGQSAMARGTQGPGPVSAPAPHFAWEFLT